MAAKFDTLLGELRRTDYPIPEKAFSGLSVLRQYYPVTDSYQSIATVGPSGRNYTTIQSALAAGHRFIIIDPGVYAETVSISWSFTTLVCQNGYAVVDGINQVINPATAFATGVVSVARGAYGCYFENICANNGAGHGFFCENSDGSSVGRHIFVNCRAEDNFLTGFYIQCPDTLCYHCYSGFNYAWLTVSGGGPGEHSDGFTTTSSVYADNNHFRYCVADSNSDDGFDCYRSPNNVFYGCVSIENGYELGNRNRTFTRTDPFTGNGNGFKLGSNEDGGDYKTVAKYCTAYLNQFAGFNTNGSLNATIDHCIAIENHRVQQNTEQVMTQSIIAGTSGGHTVKNCVANNQLSTTISLTGNTVTHNSWQFRDIPFSQPNIALSDFSYDRGLLFTHKAPPPWYTGIVGDETQFPFVSLESAIIDLFT